MRVGYSLQNNYSVQVPCFRLEENTIIGGRRLHEHHPPNEERRRTKIPSPKRPAMDGRDAEFFFFLDSPSDSIRTRLFQLSASKSDWSEILAVSNTIYAKRLEIEDCAHQLGVRLDDDDSEEEDDDEEEEEDSGSINNNSSHDNNDNDRLDSLQRQLND